MGAGGRRAGPDRSVRRRVLGQAAKDGDRGLAEARQALEDRAAELQETAEQSQAQTAKVAEMQEQLARQVKEREQLQQALSEAHQVAEGRNAQLAPEAELRGALEPDLDVSRRAIDALKQLVDQPESDTSDGEEQRHARAA